MIQAIFWPFQTAAVKMLPEMAAVGGDTQRDTHRHMVLGRPGELCKRKEQEQDESPAHTVSSPGGYHRDGLGLLLCGWCCCEQD